MSLTPVLACRRVVWDLPGEAAVIYPDSDIEPCPECEADIYVGPRARRMREEHALAKVMCFECSFDLVAEEADAGFATLLTNLGNPYTPEDGQ